MKRIFKLLPLLAFSGGLLLSCGDGSKPDYSKEVDEGSFDGNKYNSPTLGWTMEYPDNWLITKKASLEALDERSKIATGETDTDMSGIKRLLAFQKNFNNSFMSTMESFGGKTEQEYYNVIYDMHERIYNNYLDQRTPLDTSNMTIQVGELKFDGYDVNLYDKQHKNFANQLMITGVVKDHFMSITIVYDNNEDKTKMLNLFKASTFK